MANAWVPVNAEIGIQDILTDDTTQNHPLGKRIRAKHSTYGEAEFIYLKGVVSTVAGSLVTWDGDYQSALVPANATSDTLPGVDVAAAMTACVAADYGWYMVAGNHPNVPKGTIVAGSVNLFTSSVAGAVQAATVSGRYIMGIRSASSVNSTNTTYDTVEAILQYPRINPKGGTPA